ncbi:WXG100 family type VII secretion target [Priestia megaterium]|nr:WXG100 family type VII secretion target [Priestia megaterium]
MEIKVKPEELELFAERIQQSRAQAAETLQRLNWESTNLHFLSVANVEKVLDLQEELQQMIRKLETLTENAHFLVKQTAEKMRQADQDFDESSGWTQFWSGVWDGGSNGIQDTWDGIKSLAEWDTYEGMWEAIQHPLETLDSMWASLSKSWEDKVVNGDLHSRTEFFTYGVVQIGLGILGGKGIDKVSKLSKVSSPIETVETSERMVVDQRGNSSEYRPLNQQLVTITHGFDTAFSSAQLPVKRGFIEEANHVIHEVGLTKEQFFENQVEHYTRLSTDQLQMMYQVREAVPPLTETSILQKIVPVEALDTYLSGNRTKIGGCVARIEDVADIQSASDVFYSLRLDYEGTPFTPSSEYGVIRFTTEEYDKMKIPYAQSLNSEKAVKPDEYINFPQTGHGFTSAENGRIVPEFETAYQDGAAPTYGEVYIVRGDVEELVGLYDPIDQQFVRIEDVK